MAQVKIQKGDKVLKVSERLYRVYYSGLGYKKAEVEAPQQVDDNHDVEPVVENEVEGAELPAYDDITKAEIVEQLKAKGIEHNARDPKEDLYALLEGE